MLLLLDILSPVGGNWLAKNITALRIVALNCSNLNISTKNLRRSGYGF